MINRILIILIFISFLVLGTGWYEIAYPPFHSTYQPIHPRGLQYPIPAFPDLNGGAWTPGNSTGTPMQYPKATANPLYNPQKTCINFINGNICQ